MGSKFNTPLRLGEMNGGYVNTYAPTTCLPVVLTFKRPLCGGGECLGGMGDKRSNLIGTRGWHVGRLIQLFIHEFILPSYVI